jgi:hypothetical protein
LNNIRFIHDHEDREGGNRIPLIAVRNDDPR